VGSEVVGSVTNLSSFSDVVFRLVFNRQAPLTQILERLAREPSTLQVFARVYQTEPNTAPGRSRTNYFVYVLIIRL
jgi:hypothetical protein